ncbi:unnamed protein product [Chrysoparadoxa australica]
MTTLLAGGQLAITRSPEDRAASPERLNLDKRHLKSCPVIQGEARLRLLNLQNNLISRISNLSALPSLIFLDLYSNCIDTLEGGLSSVPTLRVLMVGKNRVKQVTNLERLTKLDVLDLHSNSIEQMGGMDMLRDLRVLNLAGEQLRSLPQCWLPPAGNAIRVVQNIRNLQCLTELNLRRNLIEQVHELHLLPAMKRLFLNYNRIKSLDDCSCILDMKGLLELALDGNPLTTKSNDGCSYRMSILPRLKHLKHLDLKQVTEEERKEAAQMAPSPGLPCVSKACEAKGAIALAAAATAANREVGASDRRNQEAALQGNNRETSASIAGQERSASEQVVSQEKEERRRRVQSERKAAINAARLAWEKKRANRADLGCQPEVTPHGRCRARREDGPQREARVGYFELEKRCEEAGSNRRGAPMSLRVYGDVWLWMEDPKVARLSEEVERVSFAYVHVDRVSAHASAMARKFPNLTTLQLPDNDLVALAQLELLAPLLAPLKEVDLGNNALAAPANAAVLSSFVMSLAPMLVVLNGVKLAAGGPCPEKFHRLHAARREAASILPSHRCSSSAADADADQAYAELRAKTLRAKEKISCFSSEWEAAVFEIIEAVIRVDNPEC